MSPIRKGYADTPGGQLHYRHLPGPGIPLLLFHRTPVSGECFEPLMQRLAGTCALYAFDTPGFGASFDPPGDPSTIDYANTFLAAIDALGIERFHLFAHHTGTHFATEIAAAHPERTVSLIVNGVMYITAGERAGFRQAVGTPEPIDEGGQYLMKTWGVLSKLYPRFEPRLANLELAGALRAFEGRRQAFAAIFDQDYPAVLARVRCPVLALAAEDDPLRPFLDRIPAALPHVRTEVLGRAVIAAPELDTDRLAASIRAFIGASRAGDYTGGQRFQEPTMTIPATQKQYQLVKAAQGFTLRQAEAPVKQPGPGEVLIRMRAYSLNRRDVAITLGFYPVSNKPDLVPVSDGAGDVVAIGSGVTRVKVGDRVTPSFFQAWESGRCPPTAGPSALGGGVDGVLAEYVTLNEKGMVPYSSGLSYEEAATLPCAGVTAWSGLMRGGIQAGDYVLTQGTGGVALFGVQIAAALGAKPIVTSSSNEKIERARKLGAVAGVNYSKTPEWEKAVREATGGHGADQVLELGGVGTLGKSVASLAQAGHLALIGGLAGFGGELQAIPIIGRGATVSGILVGSRADLEALHAFVGKHSIKPVIDKVFGFDQVAEAYQHLGTAGAFGKVVIRR